MSVIDKIQSRTRWTDIPDIGGGYRLACSNPICSLSCANLRNGRILTTSIHGDERHSYIFTKNDMAFAAIQFLNELSEKELHNFCNIFNKVSQENVLTCEKI